MPAALDFDDKCVLLAVDGVVRRHLARRLESGELGTRLAWVNVTRLMPNGKTSKLFHSCVGKSPNGARPTAIGHAAIAGKTAQSIKRLMKRHLKAGRFYRLPAQGTLRNTGTHCLPHGNCVLLVSCSGFPDRRSNHALSQIIGIDLGHELLLLGQQLKPGKSTT